MLANPIARGFSQVRKLASRRTNPFILATCKTLGGVCTLSSKLSSLGQQSSRPVGRPFRYGREECGASGYGDKNDSIVPMIAKAINISERLLAHPDGMRVEEIQAVTGYSRSSIYRILRTLASFGYVTRENTGRFLVDFRTPSLHRVDIPSRLAKPAGGQGFGQ